MNNKLVLVFLGIIMVSSLLHSRGVQENPGSNCDFASLKERKRVEDWLNKSLTEAKDAVENGRTHNDQHHQLPPCKIKEIEDLYKNLIFEYSCTCMCGVGGPSHEIIKGTPFIRICDPIGMYRNRRNVDLDKPPTKVCGCIQGLIVHELVHASGDLTEEGAVDCARILYPCEDDPFGDATSDQRNCECCDKKGN